MGIGVLAVQCVLFGVGAMALIGPFVFLHKLLKAMNQMNADFNVNG